MHTIADDRPLSAEERLLVAWMLDHGTADARSFLPQLAAARVVARCGCGCVSVDLAVDGRPRTAGGPLRVLGDFVYGTGDELCGIFVFERGGVLAGLEVYALSDATPTRLPVAESLRPFGGDPTSTS